MYLDSKVSEDGILTVYIKSIIAVAKVAFTKKDSTLISRNSGIGAKINVIESFVWNVVLFECETQALEKETRKEYRLLRHDARRRNCLLYTSRCV